MHIRRATGEDAAVLSALSRETFSETFAHLYRPEDLAAYLDSAYAVEAYRTVLEEAGGAAWLAEDDSGKAQGYVLAGPAGLPHADIQPGDMELKRLYLRREAQNAGLGSRLFAEAEAWMRRNGPAAMWIGVWSENTGAQRFYARHGYHKVGEYLFAVGQARDLEFILKKSLHAPVA